jgi:ADP-heptose:LPS heptosyltransferase
MSAPSAIPPEWRAARRVLAVRLDNLGDVLVTTPAIRAIRRCLPEAELTLLASPVGAQVGRLNPDLDDVIVYQSPQMDPWQRMPQDSAREQRLIALLKERRFDAAVIFTSFRQCALVPAYQCYLADIPLRAAASVDGPGSLLTTRHKHPERMMHEVERGLDLVGALGMGTEETDLVLTIPEDLRLTIDDLRLEQPDQIALFEDLCLNERLATYRRRRRSAQGPHIDLGTSQIEHPGAAQRPQIVNRTSKIEHPLVVIHPGCSMPARTYAWEQFAEAADLLVERLGARVVLTGGPDERELVERVRGRMRRPALALAGALPFAQFCALIAAADLTVTNNTGPMHIAAALKTPVVALFALTNPPEQWGPWRVPHRLLYHEVPCRLCYSRACPYGHECLRLVTPEQIVQAAMELRSMKYEV